MAKHRIPRRYRIPGLVAIAAVVVTVLGTLGVMSPASAASATATDTAFTYTGAWNVATGEHWSNTAGASAVASVTVGSGGGTISVSGVSWSGDGYAGITVDSSTTVLASTYRNVGCCGQATWWTSPLLAAGAHSVTVSVAGVKPVGATDISVSITGIATSNGTIATPSTGGGGGGTTVGALTSDGNSGRPFSSTGPWNSVIPANPVLTSNTAAQVSTIKGNVAGEFYAYGDPVFTATSSDPVASVTCTEPWGTCDPQARPIRIPTNAQPTSGSDGALVVAEPDTNSVCDFWQVTKTATSSYRASWATCDTLTDDDAVGPSGGSTGGNINVLAGVVRTFEVRQVTAGTLTTIPHALSLATGNSCSTFQYPAAKSDGGSGANCVPEGARLQLDPSINVDAIAGITPLEKAVAHTLQTYGAYNRDNCGSSLCVAFENPNGETDPYPAAGVPGDYWNMPHIPWGSLRVLHAWNGS